MEAWYAIRVRSNLEKQVQMSLSGKGLESFLPLCPSTSRWSDRLKKTLRPLFPGYLFGHFDPVRRLPVLSTPGVVNILGNSSGPVAVDETELDSVRRLVAGGRPVTQWPCLRAGDRVVVDNGPFAGAEGWLLREKDEFRLVVCLTLLQRAVSVELDREAVRPQFASPAPALWSHS
jgi:transcription antitermination factor NusG